MSTGLSDLRARLRSGAPAPAVVSGAPAPGGSAPARAGRVAAPSPALARPARVEGAWLGWTRRLMPWSRPSWTRRFPRHPCCVMATLEIGARDIALDGLVTELSLGGLLFRPASAFVFDRLGAAVTVRVGDDELEGLIVNVKETGYGVRFHESIAEERMAALLRHYGLPEAAA
jgi:hypothetical protein